MLVYQRVSIQWWTEGAVPAFCSDEFTRMNRRDIPFFDIFVAPLWWTNIAIENGPVEIVDFPIFKNGGSFHSFLYVHQRLPEFWREKSAAKFDTKTGHQTSSKNGDMIWRSGWITPIFPWAILQDSIKVGPPVYDS